MRNDAMGASVSALILTRALAAPAHGADFRRAAEASTLVSTDVVFVNERAGVRLAGTLTLPGSGEPSPAVVLVTGSGLQDRDETIMSHKPFRAIAQHLARRGFAMLRYDERLLAEQNALISRAMGAEEGYEELREASARMIAIIMAEKDDAVAERKIRELRAEELAKMSEARRKEALERRHRRASGVTGSAAETGTTDPGGLSADASFVPHRPRGGPGTGCVKTTVCDTSPYGTFHTDVASARRLTVVRTWCWRWPIRPGLAEGRPRARRSCRPGGGRCRCRPSRRCPATTGGSEARRSHPRPAPV
jgi:hypothetical protein